MSSVRNVEGGQVETVSPNGWGTPASALSEAVLTNGAAGLFRDKDYAAVDAILANEVTLLAGFTPADVPIFTAGIASSL